ncbi:MAG: hypothetical protein JWP26_1896 [Devosia sp.]|uniref:hypothetical protein n=1 Tax=Devosia sp. TaxID=1871048 RepID=UPI00262E29A0|nr:hypothetical protein [Devosia sp.]MDB5586926.1 hypothetical protein [Devosia sp.]
MTNDRIHTTVRAIVITTLLGLGAVAAPAMAQSPGFGFGPGFDDRPGDRFDPPLPMCMTDNQIRQTIAEYGYSHISLNVPNEKRIQVRATLDGTVYLIKFNYCTGRIEDRDALRRAQ